MSSKKVNGVNLDEVVEEVVEDEEYEPTDEELEEMAEELEDDDELEDDEDDDEDDEDDKPKKTRARKETWEADDDSVDSEMPEGFSFDTHSAIARKKFAHDKYYWGHQVHFHEYKLARARKEKDFAEKFGSKKEQRAVKKMQKLQAQIGELKKTLEARGVNVDSLGDLSALLNK